MIKAVIFDLDDTLYNYKKLNDNAIEELCKFTALKLNISKENVKNAFDKARNATKDYLKNTASEHNRMIYCQKTLEYLYVNPIEYALDMYEKYWEYILDNMKLNDGVLVLFDFIKERNMKIGICTDLTTHIQHRKIKTLGIEEYIDAIVTSEEVGREKPDEIMFKAILNKLKVQSNEAIYVGDSLEKDIIGAINVGIHAVWYNEMGEKADRKSHFVYDEVNDFDGVKAVIGK